MLKHLLCIQFFIYIISSASAQDWQVVDNNQEFGCEYLAVLNVNNQIYAASSRINSDTIQGLTIYHYDTSGQLVSIIDIFIDTFILTTFQDYLGFCQIDTSIYLYGTVYPSWQTYLIKTNLALSYYEIDYYSPQNPSSIGMNATNMLATEQGLYLIGSEQISDQYWTSDAYIIHTDFEGNEKWRKSYGNVSVEELPTCIIRKNENDLVMGGGRFSPFNQNVPFQQKWWHEWIMAIDTVGNLLWEWESPDGKNRGEITNLQIIQDKYYIVGGEIAVSGSSQFNTRPDITHRNSLFDEVWRTKLDVTNPTNYVGYFTSTALTPDSAALIAVAAYHKNNRPLTHFKVRLSDGEVLYHRQDPACAPNSSYTYEGSLYDVTMLPSGSTVACGSLDVQTTGGERIYGLLIKTNAWGQDLLDDCSTVSNNEPQYAQNEIFIYPNPCSDYFTIEPPSGYMGAYRVRLYAVTGALVRDQEYAQSEVPHIDVHDLPSGLYYVRVVSAQGQLLGVGKVVNSE
jgi:hypothetical protein